MTRSKAFECTAPNAFGISDGVMFCVADAFQWRIREGKRQGGGQAIYHIRPFCTDRNRWTAWSRRTSEDIELLHRIIAFTHSESGEGGGIVFTCLHSMV